MGDSQLKNAHPSAQQAHDGRSMRERLLAGDLYIADDPQLAAESRHAAKLTQQFNTSDPSDLYWLLGSSVRENHCKSERAYLLWLQKTYSSGTM
jgi:hypothetical protein